MFQVQRSARFYGDGFCKTPIACLFDHTAQQHVADVRIAKLRSRFKQQFLRIGPIQEFVERPWTFTSAYRLMVTGKRAVVRQAARMLK